MASRKQNQMLTEGAEAPDFKLRDLSGLERATSGHRPILLVFFKVSCPTCQYTFPFLERLWRNRTNRDADVFAVSQDDPESTREFHQEFGITIPTLLDEEEEGYPVSNAYRLSHVPSLFWIEPNGRISLSLSGFDKKGLQTLGERLGAEPFEPGESVPEWKPG
jgi:peroxiredoxin